MMNGRVILANVIVCRVALLSLPPNGLDITATLYVNEYNPLIILPTSPPIIAPLEPVFSRSTPSIPIGLKPCLVTPLLPVSALFSTSRKTIALLFQTSFHVMQRPVHNGIAHYDHRIRKQTVKMPMYHLKDYDC